jgi:hypothetical protein
MDEFHSEIKDLDTYINKADDIDRIAQRLKNSKRKEKEPTKEKGRSYALNSRIPSKKTDPDGYK